MAPEMASASRQGTLPTCVFIVRHPPGTPHRPDRWGNTDIDAIFMDQGYDSGYNDSGVRRLRSN